MDLNQNHTVQSYNQQLEQVVELIIKMGSQVTNMLKIAEANILEVDSSAAKQINKREKKLDNLDDEVNQVASTIIALRAPVGVDLRLLIASVKMAGSLERMGDLANINVTRCQAFIAVAPKATLKKLAQLSSAVTDMLDVFCNAFKNLDDLSAQRVEAMDDKADDLYHDIYAEVVEEITKNPKNTADLTEGLFVAKNYERIGDNATKLAKLLSYINSGELTIH